MYIEIMLMLRRWLFTALAGYSFVKWRLVVNFTDAHGDRGKFRIRLRQWLGRGRDLPIPGLGVLQE
jgi:hypothetical protein